MRRLYTTIIFLIFISPVFTQVIIENSIADLGTIVEAKGSIKTSFYLIGGKDSSEIVNVETSCGCTTVISKDKIIRPGQRIKLDASYDPVGRPGHFSKAIQVTVITKGKKQFLNLILKGRVIRSGHDLSRNTLKISKIHVEPIELSFKNEYDTTNFASVQLNNFLNTITYVIDKDNFVTIDLAMDFAHESFLNESGHWVKKLTSKLNLELEKRGYKPYQINYNRLKWNVSNDYTRMGRLGLFVPKYYDSSMHQNWVAYNYEDLNDEILMTCQNESKEEFKQFQEGVDSLLTNQFLVTSETYSLHLNGRFTHKKWLKKAVKMGKTLRKEYGTKLDLLLDVELADSFEYVLFSPIEKPKINSVNVNHEFKVELDKPPLTSYVTQWAEMDFKNPSYILMIEQLKELKDSVEIHVQLNIPYFKKKPNQIKMMKKMNLLQVVLNENFNMDQLKIKKIHTNLLMYEVKDQAELSSSLLIVPFLNEKKEIRLKPYTVQFNSNQFSLDATSYVLKNFVKSLIEEINTNGFVQLIIESSSSNAPTRTDLSAVEMSFIRRDAAEEYLRSTLEEKGVDPNRLIIQSKNAFVDGPKYGNDYFENKEKYRKYQYLKLIPVKVLD